MRPPRRRGHAPGPKFRPENVESKRRDVLEFMAANGIAGTEWQLCMLFRSVEIWPDDPAVQAEQLAGMDRLAEYRAAFAQPASRE